MIRRNVVFSCPFRHSPISVMCSCHVSCELSHQVIDIICGGHVDQCCLLPHSTRPYVYATSGAFAHFVFCTGDQCLQVSAKQQQQQRQQHSQQPLQQAGALEPKPAALCLTSGQQPVLQQAARGARTTGSSSQQTPATLCMGVPTGASRSGS